MSRPSQPFRVGFVGTGAIAGVHLDAVTRFPGAVLVGVTDRDAARARGFAARARGVRVFPDLESMVAAGVDVVHVLTPPDTHAEEWDLDALRNAVHERFGFEPRIHDSKGLERESLRLAGLATPGSLLKQWDFSGGFGGPIKQDKLWYYATYREEGQYRSIPGIYPNLDAGDNTKWLYVQDKTKQAQAAAKGA